LLAVTLIEPESCFARSWSPVSQIRPLLLPQFNTARWGWIIIRHGGDQAPPGVAGRPLRHPLEIGRLIALVDSLCIGALNAVQSEAVRQLPRWNRGIG